MEDPNRDERPGVFLLVQTDTRLYTYPPIKMYCEFPRSFTGKDKTFVEQGLFHTFSVEALQEL